MRVISLIAKWLFIACLPLLLVTASLAWAVNSFWLYRHGMDANEVGRVTGLALSELDKAAAGLIRYWNSSEPDIDLTVAKGGNTFQLFNEREIVHLRDVKTLIRLDYRVLLASLLFAIGYAALTLLRGRPRELARAAFAGSVLTLGLMAVIGLGMLVSFDQLFLQFHLLSFTNEFWQLDPARDYLIMLFPERFWNDAAWYIAAMTAGLAIALVAVARMCLRVGGKARAKTA